MPAGASQPRRAPALRWPTNFDRKKAASTAHTPHKRSIDDSHATTTATWWWGEKEGGDGRKGGPAERLIVGATEGHVRVTCGALPPPDVGNLEVIRRAWPGQTPPNAHACVMAAKKDHSPLLTASVPGCRHRLHRYRSTDGVGLPRTAPELREDWKAHLPGMASVLDLQLDFDTPGEKLKWLLVIQLGLSAFLSDSAAAVAAVGLVAVLWPHRELLSIFLVGRALVGVGAPRAIDSSVPPCRKGTSELSAAKHSDSHSGCRWWRLPTSWQTCFGCWATSMAAWHGSWPFASCSSRRHHWCTRSSGSKQHQVHGRFCTQPAGGGGAAGWWGCAGAEWAPGPPRAAAAPALLGWLLVLGEGGGGREGACEPRHECTSSQWEQGTQQPNPPPGRPPGLASSTEYQPFGGRAHGVSGDPFHSPPPATLVNGTALPTAGFGHQPATGSPGADHAGAGPAEAAPTTTWPPKPNQGAPGEALL